MSKPIYDELKEAFEELKKSEAKRVYEAIENKEFPPITFTLPTVLKTIKEIVDNHEPTTEELLSALQMRQGELTPDEIKMMIEISNTKK